MLGHFIDLILSGYQDSNLGPPAPKAGALTGLRYIPFIFFDVQRYGKYFNAPNIFCTFFIFLSIN